MVPFAQYTCNFNTCSELTSNIFNDLKHKCSSKSKPPREKAKNQRDRARATSCVRTPAAKSVANSYSTRRRRFRVFSHLPWKSSIEQLPREIIRERSRFLFLLKERPPSERVRSSF
ncbi:hypothetical protein EUGRSUZ_I02535 [Eucalyptus grandis]|uniref:Uncharacterized protein n=2 Tax=Eucalyptus grandis TaxID=71139 RepID=A0ACC3JJJ2_EUCGR|nr:hypothetical protein EUGRSUZ_I02535 [Eucalyptus grandis]